MSANLELVRSIFASIGRGNYRSADWADPQIRRVVVEGPDPDSVSGPHGLAHEMRNLFYAFDDLRNEADEYRELDDQRVLVLTRASGRGKKSGVPFVQRGAELFEIHNGKVTKIIVYFDRDRALADLGLEG